MLLRILAAAVGVVMVWTESKSVFHALHVRIPIPVCQSAVRGRGMETEIDIVGEHREC